MNFLDKLESNKFTYKILSICLFSLLVLQGLLAVLSPTMTRMFFLGATTVALIVALANLYFWWDEDNIVEDKKKSDEEIDDSITAIEEWKSSDFAKLDILENQLSGK